MLVDLFDYVLPVDRIAQEPRPRGTSKLLVLDPAAGTIEDRAFPDFPARLRPGDLLVRNDARVVPARLLGERDGRPVEIFLLGEEEEGVRTVLARPGRRARAGNEIALPGGHRATVVEVLPGGKRRVRFDPPLTRDRLAAIGHVPLPPYIRRADDSRDRDWYQTVFARAEGAVAAPTAGLHFTTGLLDEIAARGIEIVDLTLLVGAGTFRPVSVSEADEHVMDAERVRIPPATIDAIARARSRGGRIVAVGTTVTRALESWARHGEREFATDLFIRPGFDFRVVDALLTNFHLPRSTLLMLVSAFAGRERVLGAYDEALRRGYRFYSYGDAMFVTGRRPTDRPDSDRGR